MKMRRLKTHPLSKRLVGLWLLAAIVLLPGLCWPADTVFRLDTAFDGTWHDAEKSKMNRDDDWLCWASTAANVLAWSGWGITGDLKNADQIFSYYARHWSDNPSGSPREAWRWWFTGENKDTDGAKVVVQGGRFFPDVPFPERKWGHGNGALFRGVGQRQMMRDQSILQKMLQSGYGVVIQIIYPLPNGRRDSHMMTLWGFSSGANNSLKAILVTDSDDAKEFPTATDAEDTLAYYPVTLIDGFWWLKYRGKLWKIIAAYGLLKKDLYR